MRPIRHGELTLALHELSAKRGPSLLLLHALFGAGRDWLGDADAWPGSVHALDFAGHGESSWRPGGAYTPELFAADVDAALAALGPSAIAGVGLGAYVAVLVAGARPDLVPATLLVPGPGLDGEPLPAPPVVEPVAPQPDGSDPMVGTCARDVRPPDYAIAFAARARSLLLAEDGTSRPPWWAALRGSPNVRGAETNRRRALADLAGVVG